MHTETLCITSYICTHGNVGWSVHIYKWLRRLLAYQSRCCHQVLPALQYYWRVLSPLSSSLLTPAPALSLVWEDRALRSLPDTTVSLPWEKIMLLEEMKRFCCLLLLFFVSGVYICVGGIQGLVGSSTELHTQTRRVYSKSCLRPSYRKLLLPPSKLYEKVMDFRMAFIAATKPMFRTPSSNENILCNVLDHFSMQNESSMLNFMEDLNCGMTYKWPFYLIQSI